MKKKKLGMVGNQIETNWLRYIPILNESDVDSNIIFFPFYAIVSSIGMCLLQHRVHFDYFKHIVPVWLHLN